ncbi:MAG: alpha/beta hydrolase [Proteobacteria bacterium]|nr:alpha/beta hydrolase [Pseudomonadota bacterium]
MPLFCAVFLWALTGFARGLDFSQFATTQMEVLLRSHPAMQPVENVPFLMRPFEQEKWKWSPRGRLNRIPSENCQTLKGGFTSWAQQIESCDSEIHSGWNNLLVNSLGSLWMQLDVFNHPYAHHVLFHLPGGVQLKGYLGLKDTSKARPLIIFRAGVFSTMSQFFGERYLFQQLFEQSPFNLLLLESLSGAEYNSRNQRSAFGGFDEGQQNFLVAQLLKNQGQPISRLITEIHLMGASMGGHGMYYAALLNQEQSPKARPFSSFLGLCPLTDFKNTFEFHESQGFSLAVVDAWARGRLKILSERYPEINPSHFFKSSSQVLANLYREPLMGWLSATPQLQLPASYLNLKNLRLEGKLSPSELFWKANDFLPSFKNVQTPILVLASENDPLVPFPLNTRKIKEKFWDLGDSQIQVASLKYGFHCSNGIAYDWWSHSRLLQDYFLKMSRSQLGKRSVLLGKSSSSRSDDSTQEILREGSASGESWALSKRVESPVFENSFLIVKNPQQLSLEFEMPLGAESLTYRLKIFAKRSEVAGDPAQEATDNAKDPQLTSELKEIVGKIPLSQLDFETVGPVKERAHQQMILRWAYQNIILNPGSSALEWLVWQR